MSRADSRQLAIDTARAAHVATGKPEYFVEPFEPHAWVVDAIETAHAPSLLDERLERIERALIRIAEAIEAKS